MGMTGSERKLLSFEIFSLQSDGGYAFSYKKWLDYVKVLDKLKN